MRIVDLDAITSGRLRVIDERTDLHAIAASLAEPGTEIAVVCNGSGIAIGVLTKSDLVRYLAQRTAGERTARAMMSRPVISCTPQDDLYRVWQHMVAHRIQNVPVLDPHSRPLGVLDIRDAMKALLEQEELQEHMLINYIAGIGYR